MPTYIDCQELTKSFKSFKKEPGVWGSLKNIFIRDYQVKQAVNQFSFTAEKGEIIGLLGPNGAGKTTLMKMFTGIIVPTSGTLSIGGHTPHKRDLRFRHKIALVMGQKSQLWWDIPAMDSFLLLQSYYEIPEQKFKQKLMTMAETLQVEELLHVHIRKLSLGERMKMELMASLLHQPEIIFLDEPTIGLDLVAQDNIRQFIKDYHREHRVTIVLTSHYMADVHALCERLVLIQKGRKTFDGPIEEFEGLLGNEKKVRFQFEHPIEAQQRQALEQWKAQWSDNQQQVDLAICDKDLREASTYILQHFPVTNFFTEKLPIEEVMKTLMVRPNDDLSK